MPSQHGAKLWAQKEAKQLARRSIEIVKGVIPHIVEKEPPVLTPPLADSPIVMDTMIPDALQKGTTMLKMADGKKKAIVCRIDPDEGQILYKSSKEVIGAFRYSLK
jgi:hypothetical protein